MFLPVPPPQNKNKEKIQKKNENLDETYRIFTHRGENPQ